MTEFPAPSSIPESSTDLALPTELLRIIFINALIISPKCKMWDPTSDWWNGNQFVGITCDEESLGLAAPLAPKQDKRHPNNGPLFGDLHEPPWSLFHVCRRWRDIATSTPELWKYIHLCFCNTHNRQLTATSTMEQMVSMLNMALKYSEPHGLDIVISGSSATLCDGYYPIIPTEIFIPLALHVKRWERLYLVRVRTYKCHWDYHIPREHDTQKLFFRHPAATLTLPLLKAIVLDNANYILPPRFATPNLETWYSWDHRPSLPFRVDQNITGNLLNYGCSLYTQATRFIEQVETMSQRMPCLTQLRVSLNDSTPIDGTSLPWLDTQACIEFPHLATLSLGMLHTETLGHFLDIISTPELKNLHLLCLDRPSSLKSFLQHSSCSLSSLRIDYACLDSQDVQRILRCTPAIEDLHLSFHLPCCSASHRPTESAGILSDDLLTVLFDSSEGIGPATTLLNLELNMVRGANMTMIMHLLEKYHAHELLDCTFKRNVTLGICGHDESDLNETQTELLRTLQIQKRPCVHF